MPATLTILPRDLIPGCGDAGSEGARAVVATLSWCTNDAGAAWGTTSVAGRPAPLTEDVFKESPAAMVRLPETPPEMEPCTVEAPMPIAAELIVAVLPGAALTDVLRVVLPEAVLAKARSMLVMLALVSPVCSENRCKDEFFLTAGPGPMLMLGGTVMVAPAPTLGGAVEIPSSARLAAPPPKPALIAVAALVVLFSTRCQPPAAASPPWPFSPATRPPPM